MTDLEKAKFLLEMCDGNSELILQSNFSIRSLENSDGIYERCWLGRSNTSNSNSSVTIIRDGGGPFSECLSLEQSS